MPRARRPLIVGNWKMHKTIREARAFATQFREATLPEGVDVVIAPPFTALAAVREVLMGTTIGIGAQTMSGHEAGPYTGEISALMLIEVGTSYVVLGHSERRAQAGETDGGVNLKVHMALANGITPIVAVGESEAEHDAGYTLEKVIGQTRAAFAGVAEEDVARCVVAYEPIWAIGTGHVETPPGADAVIGEIRHCVPGLQKARLLYGGSMKPDNAAALMVQPNIDGGLVGGASLMVPSFLAIIEAAALSL